MAETVQEKAIMRGLDIATLVIGGGVAIAYALWLVGADLLTFVSTIVTL